MTGRVAVVTDGSHCLPPHLVSEYNIHVAHASVIIGGESYCDAELTNEEFWELFYRFDGKATSSAASIGEFITIFSKLAKSTNGIACIIASKAISATHEIAFQAAETVKSDRPGLNIEIIDSKTSAGALGFIVLEAARAAKNGAGLEDVVSIAEDMVDRAKLVIGLDTLKYLIRGGRAPKMGYVGELLNVKPIVGSVSGEGLVDVLGKVRGRKKCMHRIAELVRENTDAGKPVNMIVHYTDGIAAGEELKDIIASKVECGEIYMTPLTPAMCSHLGPVVGVSFYS